MATERTGCEFPDNTAKDVEDSEEAARGRCGGRVRRGGVGQRGTRDAMIRERQRQLYQRTEMWFRETQLNCDLGVGHTEVLPCAHGAVLSRWRCKKKTLNSLL